MICTFECTFCRDCVENILLNVCPNCGGGLEKRPTRPKELLVKYPSKNEQLLSPIDTKSFNTMLKKYQNINPDQR